MKISIARPVLERARRAGPRWKYWHRFGKDSGIVNDSNLWAAETMHDPAYPLKLFYCKFGDYEERAGAAEAVSGKIK